MEEHHERLASIFLLSTVDAFKRLNDDAISLVQYTSAEAAMSIIKNKEVWLRNVQGMNDFMEVEHGIDCLAQAFKNEQEGKKFKALIESMYPGFISKFANIFDSWLPFFRQHTYISCISEHPKSEDLYGRLSMWRAYGGKRPVAIVMNNMAFQSESDALEIYTYPVMYLDSDQFNLEFEKLTDRISDNREFLLSIGEDTMNYYLFETFKSYALCVKHPAFKEEREWRLIYTPNLKPSDYIGSSVQSINGMPQKIYKIPLKNIPEEKLTGIEIPELIQKIIIGPTDNQAILFDAFVELLSAAGCTNPEKLVHYSGIPLRQD